MRRTPTPAREQGETRGPGWPERARRIRATWPCAREALRVATDINHPTSLAVASRFLGYVHVLRGEIDVAVPLLERGFAIAREHDLFLATVFSASQLAYAPGVRHPRLRVANRGFPTSLKRRILQSAKMTWAGRVVSVLVVLPFLPSAGMKLVRHPEAIKGMEHLGLPASLILPLAVLELFCVAVYAVPRTSVLGAILLAGYLGGAILTHLRVGEMVYLHVAIGILVWLGLWLREPRLRALLPLRRPAA